jgi:hypothetical protein
MPLIPTTLPPRNIHHATDYHPFFTHNIKDHRRAAATPFHNSTSLAYLIPLRFPYHFFYKGTIYTVFLHLSSRTLACAKFGLRIVVDLNEILVVDKMRISAIFVTTRMLMANLALDGNLWITVYEMLQITHNAFRPVLHKPFNLRLTRGRLIKIFIC